MLEKTSLETMQKFGRLQLALVGPEKSGKSHLAATGRKPVLVNDHDQRKQTLAGLKDVYALTYIDPVWPEQPSAYADALSVLTMIEGGADLRQLGFDNVDAGVKPRTLVRDSLSTFARSAMLYAMYSNPDIRRTIRVGGREIHMPYGWDAWSAETNMVQQVLDRELALTNLDIIWIFHETDEEAAGSNETNKQFTGKKVIWPNRYRGFLKPFNEVWRVTREADIPQVQVAPDYRFTAASDLDFSKIPLGEMKPDIGYLIQRSTGLSL